jgi:DNA polymerase I-like protein with 3'-5' exonuclease and polymerase domains
MIAYGMSAFKLYDKLNGDGFPIEFEVAKELYEKYCKEFKTGVDYLRSSGREALKQGWIANANGRRRNWIVPTPDDFIINKEGDKISKYPMGRFDPKYKGRISGIQREGGNFLIQSASADVTKLSMIHIRNLIKKRRFRSNLILQVYDELVTSTHKNDSEEFHYEKVNIMKEAASTWVYSVPIEVDGHVLPYWTK